MATLNNLVGFETGGLEELSASSGTPLASTSIVKTGSYSLELNASADQADFAWIEGGSNDGGNDYIYGFALHFTAAPSSNWSIFEARQSTPDTEIVIRMNTDRTLSILDDAGVSQGTGSTALSTDTWYYIELMHERSVLGDATLYLDGNSEISVISEDFTSGLTPTTLRFNGPPDGIAYLDDIYSMSGATSVSDFLGPRTEVLGAYQNTVEDATDQGSALNNGEWNDVGENPFTDSTQADYQQTGAIEGYTICDEGHRAGPAGDAPGTIIGAKYIHRMARTNGSSPTTLDKSFGNSGDGVTAVDVAGTLTVAFQNLFVVSEAASVVPTNAENFAMGMGQTGSGGRDVLAYEMVAFLLHIQSALSTTLADMNFPDHNYSLGPFGT